MIVPTKTARLILYVGVLTRLTGCASRTARMAATPVGSAGSANNDYLDIQAGWRLTVVTPILKSGGYVLKTPDKPRAARLSPRKRSQIAAKAAKARWGKK